MLAGWWPQLGDDRHDIPEYLPRHRHFEHVERDIWPFALPSGNIAAMN
jgi:hypothetical protein